MTTGEKIKFFRKENRMSQKELSNLIHKSLKTVQLYEDDSIDIPSSTLNLIASVFNVCLTDMLPGTPLPGMPNLFNETLRQHIITCVKTIDDRQTLLRMAIDIEKILTNLAEKENNTPCK